MIIEDPADFLAAVQRLKKASGTEAKRLVDDMLETIQHLKAIPNGAYHKGRVAERIQQGERELIEVKWGRRSVDELSAPPSLTELELATVEQYRIHHPDEYAANEEAQAYERELLAKAGGLTPQAKADVAELDNNLAAIQDLKRKDYDAFMKDEGLRTAERELLKVKYGETSANDLPPPPTAIENRLSEIQAVRRADWNGYMRNDALRAEERNLLDQLQPQQEQDNE